MSRRSSRPRFFPRPPRPCRATLPPPRAARAHSQPTPRRPRARAIPQAPRDSLASLWVALSGGDVLEASVDGRERMVLRVIVGALWNALGSGACVIALVLAGMRVNARERVKSSRSTREDAREARRRAPKSPPRSAGTKTVLGSATPPSPPSYIASPCPRP